jgi:hypothetical protein
MDFENQDQMITVLHFSLVVEDDYYAVLLPGDGCIPPRERLRSGYPKVGD